MRATSLPWAEITGNLPFFDSFKILFAARRSTPSCAVTNFSTLVMMVLTGALRSAAKSVSRFVTRPSSREPMRPSSVTG